MKFLKSTLAKGEEGILKRMIHQRVGGYEPARPHGRIHASDLTKMDVEFCPRAHRLQDIYKVKGKEQYIDTPLQITFDEGKDKQSRLNNVYLRDVMVGDWECQSCGEVRKWSRAPKDGCNNPKARCRWEYVEPRVEDAVTKASGGLDGLVATKVKGKLLLVECKIIDKDYFIDLKMPMAEHRVRTRLYLALLARSKEAWAAEIDTTKAHVLYMLRGYGKKDETGNISPFKEYIVTRDDTEVAEYLAKAHALTFSRENPDVGTPCGVCANFNDKRAMKCPVRVQCFSGKHPWSITWLADGKPADSEVKLIANGETVHGHQD